MVFFEFVNGNGIPQMVCSDHVAAMRYEPMWGGQQAVTVRDEDDQVLFHLPVVNSDAAIDIMRMLANEVTEKVAGHRMSGYVVLEERVENINRQHQS